MQTKKEERINNTYTHKHNKTHTQTTKTPKNKPTIHRKTQEHNNTAAQTTTKTRKQRNKHKQQEHAPKQIPFKNTIKHTKTNKTRTIAQQEKRGQPQRETHERIHTQNEQ